MSLEATLSTVEAQLQSVQDALLATDPLTLEKAAVQLRAAATELAQALGGSGVQPDDGQARRIRAIGARLPLLRDQLARVLALTERQTAALLPPVPGVVTYGGSRGQTAARIYRGPG